MCYCFCGQINRVSHIARIGKQIFACELGIRLQCYSVKGAKLNSLFLGTVTWSLKLRLKPDILDCRHFKKLFLSSLETAEICN